MSPKKVKTKVSEELLADTPWLGKFMEDFAIGLREKVDEDILGSVEVARIEKRLNEMEKNLVKLGEAVVANSKHLVKLAESHHRLICTLAKERGVDLPDEDEPIVEPISIPKELIK